MGARAMPLCRMSWTTSAPVSSSPNLNIEPDFHPNPDPDPKPDPDFHPNPDPEPDPDFHPNLDSDPKAWFMLWKYRCDMRRTTYRCALDNDCLFILFCHKSSATSGNTHMISQRPACDLHFSHVAMHVASHVAMHTVAKVEPGSTFAMSRCDSLR